jgi:peptidoglycan/xylan/chitin deacetylase (PgdA/CDA1 family)
VTLLVVMYHYVRDFPRTPWPRIHGVHVDDFRRQLVTLGERYEWATAESAVAFLEGRYHPARPLCLLTFDDGLKEHYAIVTPILRDAGIQGVFLVHTSGPDGQVAAVHKNHFLLAAVPFDRYRREFGERLADRRAGTRVHVDDQEVRRFYRWDTIDVARFKYLANFKVPAPIRDAILDELFDTHLGDERAFARALYVTWPEACDMQTAGMVIGGHSHRHVPLPALAPDDKRADLTRCATRLREQLRPQPLWPFSYPYGDVDSPAIATLRELGFACAFTTAVGENDAGAELFRIRRIDPKDIAGVPAASVSGQPCTSSL